MTGGPADPQSWYVRGEADPKLARRAISPEDPLPDLAAYHAQQCAEKYLKGFLGAKAMPFRLVHDLGYLVHLCEKSAPEFVGLEDAALALSGYATEARYPREDDVACTIEEANEAIRLAEEIKGFVLRAK